MARSARAAAVAGKTSMRCPAHGAGLREAKGSRSSLLRDASLRGVRGLRRGMQGHTKVHLGNMGVMNGHSELDGSTWHDLICMQLYPLGSAYDGVQKAHALRFACAVMTIRTYGKTTQKGSRTSRQRRISEQDNTRRQLIKPLGRVSTHVRAVRLSPRMPVCACTRVH